jgi:AraC family transcriptional activator of pobA
MQKIPVRHINTATAEAGLSDNFSIREIGGLLKDEDMVQPLHRHDFYYLLALKDGSGEHSIDFIQHTINSSVVFFMRPGQVHQLTLEKGSTGYLIQFKDEFYFPKNTTAAGHLRKANSVDCYRLEQDVFTKLVALMAGIFEEFTAKKTNYEDVIKANLGILFIGLIRQQEHPASDKTTLYLQERLDKFLELLETNVFTHKQVSQYAEMLNLSVYQLNTIIKTALGKTCSEVINETIILEAKRCLLATSNQINQTAYRMGYEDVSYFIRFFKKQTGYSPEAFRNNFR